MNFFYFKGVENMKMFKGNKEPHSDEDIRQHYIILKEFLGEIFNRRNTDTPELEEIMNDIYRYMKKIAPSLYDGTKMADSYYDLYILLLNCENCLPKRFIVDTTTNFDPNKVVDVRAAANADEYLLDLIVHQTRKRLLAIINAQYAPREFKLDDFTLQNYCYISSKIVEDCCKKYNVPCKVVKIIPGYDDDMLLYGGSGFHYMTLLKIKGITYLVDCTYKQFFQLGDNLLERVGVVNNTSCLAGAFMLKDEKSRNIAKTILKRGWIKIDDDVLKRYLDGFTLSFRNGLGFEKNKGRMETKYSANQYIKFLNGEDDMFNHENLDHIGQQEMPLKRADFKLKFKK